MTRNEFMWALNNALAGFPQSEIKRMTEYYEELFNEAAEEGKTEEEVCASLGRPEDIAERVRVELAFVRAEQQPSPKTLNTVLLVILGLFALPLALPLGIALFSLLFALAAIVFSLTVAFVAAGIAMTIAGAVLIFAGIAVMAHGGVFFGLGMTGAAFIIIGISILGYLGASYLIRAMWKGIVRICRSVYSVITDKVGGRSKV